MDGFPLLLRKIMAYLLFPFSAVWNLEFSFLDCFLSKARDTNLPYYFTHTWVAFEWKSVKYTLIHENNNSALIVMSSRLWRPLNSRWQQQPSSLYHLNKYYFYVWLAITWSSLKQSMKTQWDNNKINYRGILKRHESYLPWTVQSPSS